MNLHAMLYEGATAATFGFEEATGRMYADLSSVSESSGYSSLTWMTFMPLGYFLFSYASQCYRFIAAWNLISRIQGIDLEIFHFHKERLIARKLEIDKALKTQLYSELLKERRQDVASCPICLADFEAFDMVSLSCEKGHPNGNCRHYFHQECIRTWLEKQSSCPCCRHELLQPTPTPVHPLMREFPT